MDELKRFRCENCEMTFESMVARYLTNRDEGYEYSDICCPWCGASNPVQIMNRRKKPRWSEQRKAVNG